MAHFKVKEYVEGIYYYDMEIDQKMVDDLNKSLINTYKDGFESLTMDDVIDLLGDDDTKNPRYYELNKAYYTWGDNTEHTYMEHLNSVVYDWFSDMIWDYQDGGFECMDTIEVERWVEK